jgi:hypothetical protein
MKLVHLLLLIFALGCQSMGPRAPASERGVHIVFDLDWTLISLIDSPPRIIEYPYIRVGHEVYRVTDGASEVIENLVNRPNVSVSFFSGGPETRNLDVLGQIPVNDKSALDYAYKTLHKEDLSVRAGMDPLDDSVPFTKRFAKDLRKVSSNLDQVILIDDQANFLLNETQRNNFLWLGETYDHWESYTKRTIYAQHYPESRYAPPSLEEWAWERKKIIRAWEVIDQSLNESGDTFVKRAKINARLAGLGQKSEGRKNAGADKLFKNKPIPQFIIGSKDCTTLLNALP